MYSLIPSTESWPQWGVLMGCVALSIYLEQTYRWALKVSGPVLALLVGMALSNSKIMPTESPAYDLVDNYLVPVAIPLLLLRANIARILRESGSMLVAFHVATAGTLLGAFIAAWVFRGTFDRVAEATGIMAASYIGGGVNFVAVKNSYLVPAEITNPLLVADNFIMAGFFAVILIISGSAWFQRFYPHPHSQAIAPHSDDAVAAHPWQRKEIALLEIAQAVAIAFAIASISFVLSQAVKQHTESKWVFSTFGNPYVFITFVTAVAATRWHRWMERLQGAEEIGTFLLYVFFVVIGLRADFAQVVLNVPVLFLFCLVIAAVNLLFTLIVGKWMRLNLEELMLGVNATLGGPPTAVAMAVSKGWSRLVLPGLLAGIWGYVIGTPLGIAVTEVVRRFQ